jgi:hypothetical protein
MKKLFTFLMLLFLPLLTLGCEGRDKKGTGADPDAGNPNSTSSRAADADAAAGADDTANGTEAGGAEEKPKPAKEEQVKLAIDCAKNIVADPSNWKQNCELLIDLSDHAQDLMIVESDEYKQFEDAAKNLITFGTKWVDKIDETNRTDLGTQLRSIGELDENTNQSSEVSGGIIIGVLDSNASAEAKNSNTASQRSSLSTSRNIEFEATKAVAASVGELSGSEVVEFGSLFADALEAYKNFRKKLKEFAVAP